MQQLVTLVTELFERLRQAGLPLGIDEYMLLLRALRLGFGQPDPEARDPLAALERLCAMTWIKSQEDHALFEYHFAQLAAAWQAPPPAPKPESEPKPRRTTRPSKRSESLDDIEPFMEKEESEPETELDSKPSASAEEKKPQRRSPTPGEAAEITQRVDDVISHAQTMLHLTGQDYEITSQRYTLATEYLPVTRRQMKQSWRYLRRKVREGPPIEIDVPATVRQVARDGFLLAPVLRPRRINKAALLLLLDRDGSMTPFHALSRRLAETAAASGRLGQAGVYYFHDCPPVIPGSYPPSHSVPYREHNLYRKPQCVDPHPVSDILDEFDCEQTSVLIFGDAGAARGEWDGDRIQNTAIFLYELKARGIERMAWLNPVPRSRWAKTSAEAIASFIAMFDMNRRDMHQAINVLRGRSLRGMVF